MKPTTLPGLAPWITATAMSVAASLPRAICSWPYAVRPLASSAVPTFTESWPRAGTAESETRKAPTIQRSITPLLRVARISEFTRVDLVVRCECSGRDNGAAADDSDVTLHQLPEFTTERRPMAHTRGEYRAGSGPAPTGHCNDGLL